ncbi:MAG: hypothetical protein ACI9F9_002566, partial [Candidatus Paceibacteria bacterium]
WNRNFDQSDCGGQNTEVLLSGTDQSGAKDRLAARSLSMRGPESPMEPTHRRQTLAATLVLTGTKEIQREKQPRASGKQ